MTKDHLHTQSDAAARILLDPDWTIAAANPLACQMLQASAAELTGSCFRNFHRGRSHLVGGLVDSVWFESRNCGQLPRLLTRDIEIVPRSGPSFWARASIWFGGTEGQHEISLVNIDDLSGGNPAPVALRLLNRCFGMVDEVFWIHRVSDSQYTFVSDNVEQLLGIPVNTLLGDASVWIRSIHPEDRDRIMEEFAEIRRQAKPFAMEYRIIRGDGEVRWIWDRGFPYRDSSGNVTAYMGAGQDITQRKKHEIALSRLESSRNIASITADLAHNFNNLLGIIRLSSDAIGKLSAHSDVQRKIGAIHSALDRGAEITRSLMAISSQQLLTPQAVNVNDLIRSCQALISASLGPKIDLTLDLTQLNCMASLDVSGFSQALVNMATNCREAMPDGGEVRIRTRMKRARPVSETATVDVAGLCEMIQVTVEDTGPGMSEDVLRRALSPYFSTKGRGSGSGLGLSITNGFVVQSGGWMELENRMGGGLRQTMYFPWLENAPEAAVAKRAGRRSALPRILVVDDEKDMLSIVSDALRLEGYDVEAAQSCERAMEIATASPFDAVISDIALRRPRDGLDLVTWLREHTPDAAIVLMSGYTEFNSDIPPEIDFLAKPFSTATLTDAIARALAGAAGRVAQQGDRPAIPLPEDSDGSEAGDRSAACWRSQVLPNISD